MPDDSNPGNHPSPVPAQTLEALRAEIDRIDDALLDLIEQRLSSCATVAASKAAEDDRRLKLRPRREAAVIERLVARARHVPAGLVTHIWRELMSQSLQTQVRTELVLWAERDPATLQEQVRARFGWAAPIRWAATPVEALDAALGEEAVAVIEHDPRSDWWHGLDGALAPFDSLRRPDGTLAAVAIGRVAPEDRVDACDELRQPLAPKRMEKDR